MSAVALIAEGEAGADPERVREGMSGNLCRCGAYVGIAQAVIAATRDAMARTGAGAAAAGAGADAAPAPRPETAGDAP
jgi:xanthine dehydrogenase YagT iron-sulfur-binding subunit